MNYSVYSCDFVLIGSLPHICKVNKNDNLVSKFLKTFVFMMLWFWLLKRHFINVINFSGNNTVEIALIYFTGCRFFIHDVQFF